MRSRGIYPTPQRVAIANVLFARHQHLTAEQVHEMVNQTGRRVSKATVYNTLAMLVSNGLVREVVTDPARIFYDSNTSRHYHFYNIDSGELFDMDPDIVQDFDPQYLPPGTSMEGVDLMVRIRNRT